MSIINPDIKNMQKGKTASGSASFHCGDLVATTLNGWPLENVRDLASDMGIEVSKYNHLNNGQQRMILGGSFRKRVKDQDDAAAKFDAQTELHEKDPEKNKAPEGKRPVSGSEWFTNLAERHTPPPPPEKQPAKAKKAKATAEDEDEDDEDESEEDEDESEEDEDEAA